MQELCPLRRVKVQEYQYVYVILLLIKVSPKSVICKLSSVKVVDALDSSTSSTVTPEVDLFKLGVKINEGNLLSDQVYNCHQFLNKWKHIFYNRIGEYLLVCSK